MTARPLLGIVLGAGRGRRLGGPKAPRLLGQRSYLAHAVAALRDAGITSIRVVVADARHVIDVDDVEVRIHPAPEKGQTSSLRIALSGGLGDVAGFALHTADHPLARASDVRTLLDVFAQRAEHERIVVPSVAHRRGHPALFAAALAEEFLALGDDEPAHRVVRRDPERVRHVVLENPWLVRDIDTPEDHAAAERALSDGDQPTSRT